jgi:hypothetical protein
MSTVQSRGPRTWRTTQLVLALFACGCGSTSLVKPAPPDEGPGKDAGTDAGTDLCAQFTDHDQPGFAPDAGPPVAADPECDMTGLWATRMTTWARGGVETLGANWYYLELAQDGENVMVVDHFDCGVWVDAGFYVYPTPKLEEVLYTHNIQTGRRGTMKRNGDRCDLWFNRFWSLRGADDAVYLPCGHHDKRDIADLQAAVPLPNKENPDGAEDWDEDEKPGITMLIGGSTAARYSVQRDWLEWFTCNENGVNGELCNEGTAQFYGIDASADFTSFVIRAHYNNEDSVLGATNPIYEMPTRTGVNNRVAFTLLGRTRESPDAKAFWALADTNARCARLKELLPAEKRTTAPK